VIEKVAAMASWKAGAGRAGRGRGIAFARYKNRAAYAACVISRPRGRWDRAMSRDRCRPGQSDGVINQLEGGIIQSASWDSRSRYASTNSGTSGIASIDGKPTRC
jgi:hypothetical protein